MNYCNLCGANVIRLIPEGDDRTRSVCEACRAIHYENPKMVVGCIPEWEEKILLCRRAIEPRYGKWTLPAGFLECGETMSDGAMRETLEEAKAKVNILSPYALFNLCFIHQIYLMFRARLIDGHFGPGDESLDVRLFSEEEIPWEEMAFAVVRETLRFYFNDRKSGVFPFHMGDILPSMIDPF